MTYNRGIIHLAARPGGQPFCRTRRAIMSTTPEQAEKNWSRICVKCQRVHDRRMASKPTTGLKPLEDMLNDIFSK